MCILFSANSNMPLCRISLLLYSLEFRWFDLRLSCQSQVQVLFAVFLILIFTYISGTLDTDHINQTYTSFVYCRFVPNILDCCA